MIKNVFIMIAVLYSLNTNAMHFISKAEIGECIKNHSILVNVKLREALKIIIDCFDEDNKWTGSEKIEFEIGNLSFFRIETKDGWRIDVFRDLSSLVIAPILVIYLGRKGRLIEVKDKIIKNVYAEYQVDVEVKKYSFRRIVAECLEKLNYNSSELLPYKMMKKF